MKTFTFFFWVFLVSSSVFSRPAYIFQKSVGLPLTTFNVTFRTGSADELQTDRGLAFLTARLLREGGVRALDSLPARTRAQIEELLFPMAADIVVNAGTEQTAFTVTTSSGDAPFVFEVLAQLILAPAWDAAEFDRIRGETLDVLEKQLPREDQEELGKTALYHEIFGQWHPYAHSDMGTLAGVRDATVEKVIAFYKGHYNQARLTVGMGGVFTPKLRSRVKTAFSALPAGRLRAQIPPGGEPHAGLALTFVKGPFDAVSVHFGQEIRVRRGHPDFPALLLASTAFGKHRSFVGRLMRVVREMRGLNYGCYSYIEDFPEGGNRLIEPTQVGRSRQAFTIWGRPTPAPNGCSYCAKSCARSLHFTSMAYLRKNLISLRRISSGTFLSSQRVPKKPRVCAIDSLFYGIRGDYLLSLIQEVSALTREKVNAAIKKHLNPGTLQMVVVARVPEDFQKTLFSESCPVTYPDGIIKSDAVTKEDELIARFPVLLERSRLRVVPSEFFFEK